VAEMFVAPTAEQRSAWNDFRRRCLAQGLSDPGFCPPNWPASPAMASRILEILRSTPVAGESFAAIARSLSGGAPPPPPAG
jgi:hypothetical protein